MLVNCILNDAHVISQWLIEFKDCVLLKFWLKGVRLCGGFLKP